MRKTKLYLDTSVISYIMQDDSPEKTEATNAFWDDIKTRDDVEIYLSDITIGEIDDCYEAKRTKMHGKLSEIKYTLLSETADSSELADKIVAGGIMTKKSLDDCKHIAIAVLADCDYILSWNFKHLVNVKTIKGVRAITVIQGCKPIVAWMPPTKKQKRVCAANS